jgi:hypothetical protein
VIDRPAFGERRQRRLARLLQVTLVGLLFVGFERASAGVIVNAGVALAITWLPAVLERDYGVTLSPGLVLWLTGAVFLHALGTAGLPGAERNIYVTVWWWDHLTHALSSSVVAAAGYTTVLAADRHADGVDLSPRFVAVFVLLFVVAFGVVWEVIEFGLGEAAGLTGGRPVLLQYGLGDTMLDLVFDMLGGLVVAVWGAAPLGDLVDAVGARFESR